MTSRRRAQLNRWLFSAIRSRRPARALELVNCGAEVNATSSEGESVLVCAVEYDLDELVEPLLERGADPNVAGRYGYPIHLMASSCRPLPADLSAILLRFGAKLDVRDDEGATPMFLAARAGNVALIELFQAHGAGISERNAELDTGLTFAACWGLLDQARMLLDHGIDVHARDNLGMNALAWAAKDGHVATVSLLLGHRADPNVGDLWGRTPLMRAAEHGSLACVRLLLDSGADPLAKSETGESALDAARRYAGRDVALVLREEWLPQPGLDGREAPPIALRRITTPDAEPAVVIEQMDEVGNGSSRELCDSFDAIVGLLENCVSARVSSGR